jgi:multidrug resistance efflux pump
MSKKIIRYIYIILCIGVVVLVDIGCQEEKAVDSITQKPLKQIQRNYIEAPGKIIANDTKNLTLDFSAVVQSVHVKEGKSVKLGEEIITLDIHDFSQKINDIESDLTQGNLQLKISTDAMITKQNDYKHELEVLERTREDYEKKLSSYQRLEISKDEIEAEQRKVGDVEKIVNDKKIAAEDASLSIEIQRQKLKKLEADIKELRNKLNKSFIRGNSIVSDIDNGMVQQITCVAGDTIQPNNKIVNLVNMNNIIVEAYVPEDFIKDVKVGAAVEIYPLADDKKMYKGEVIKSLGLSVEKNGENLILTQISIKNVDEFLKPNYNVDVKIFK